MARTKAQIEMKWFLWRFENGITPNHNFLETDAGYAIGPSSTMVIIILYDVAVQINGEGFNCWQLHKIL